MFVFKWLAQRAWCLLLVSPSTTKKINQSTESLIILSSVQQFENGQKAERGCLIDVFLHAALNTPSPLCCFVFHPLLLNTCFWFASATQFKAFSLSSLEMFCVSFAASAFYARAKLSFRQLSAEGWKAKGPQAGHSHVCVWPCASGKQSSQPCCRHQWWSSQSFNPLPDTPFPDCILGNGKPRSCSHQSDSALRAK